MNKSLALKNKLYLFLSLVFVFLIFLYLIYFLIDPKKGVISYYKLKNKQFIYKTQLNELKTKNDLFIDRTANKGISAFINPNGKVIKSLNTGESGNIELNFPHFYKSTLFSNYGNKIFYLIIFLYMFLILILRKYKI